MRRSWAYGQPPVGYPIELNQASPQAKGLVAWWPTIPSDGQQRLDDLSGNQYNSNTNTDAAWSSDSRFGPVGDYSAVGSWIFPADDRFDFSSSGFSVCVWLLLSSSRDNGTLYGVASRTISHFTDVDFAWTLQRSAWGTTYRFYGGDGVNPEVSTQSPSITLGVFQHLVGVWDGENLTCYLDGVAGTPTALASLNSLSAGVTVGSLRASGAVGPWLGGIGDTRLYNRPLSSAEVYEQRRKPWDLVKMHRRVWALTPPGSAVGFPWPGPRHPSKNINLRL